MQDIVQLAAVSSTTNNDREFDTLQSTSVPIAAGNLDPPRIDDGEGTDQHTVQTHATGHQQSPRLGHVLDTDDQHPIQTVQSASVACVVDNQRPPRIDSRQVAQTNAAGRRRRRTNNNEGRKFKFNGVIRFSAADTMYGTDDKL